MEYIQRLIRREILVVWKLLDYLCFGVVGTVHGKRGKKILCVLFWMQRIWKEFRWSVGLEGLAG